MENGKHTRSIWLAAAGAVLAWPLGLLVGLILSAGQDGPGTALAQGFGQIVTVVVWLISTAVLIWKLRKGVKHIRKPARATVALSIVFLPLVAIFSAASYQVYDLRVWNETGARIDDVSVDMIGKQYTFGAMRSGVTATMSFQQGRPSGIAEIRWTGEDGQSHLVEADLAEKVPRRYDNGMLTFTIEADDNVRIGFFIQQRPPF